MKKRYVALTARNVNFLLEAGLPFPLPDEGVSRYRRHKGALVPEGFSGAKSDHALWMRNFLAHSGKLERSTRDLSPPAMLRDFLTDGYTFLPLDRQSYGYVLQKGWPHEMPLDFLTFQQFSTATQQALQQTARLARSIDPALCGWSENWAQADAMMLAALASAAFLADALVPALRERASELVLIRREQPGFLPAFSCHDAVQLVWEKALSGITRLVLTPGEGLLQQSLPAAKEQDFRPMRNAIVFALYSPSIPRHIPLMRATLADAPAPPLLAVLECLYAGKADAQASLRGETIVEGLPSVVIPAFEAPADPSTGFIVGSPETGASAERQLLEKAEGLLPNAMALAPLFAQYAAVRALNFESMYQNLVSIWEKDRPAVCIAEDTAQGEYSLPLVAAARMRIPSVAVPHSTLHVPLHLGAMPASLVACSSPYCAAQYGPLTAASGACVRAFAEVDEENAYPAPAAASTVMPRQDGCANILVLPAPAFSTAPFGINSGPAALAILVRELFDIPADLEDRARVYCKMHPTADESALLLRLGMAPERLLPLDSSMADAIRAADILVGCAYFSSPALMAMRMDIPVIARYWPESILPEASTNHSTLGAARAGLLITEPGLFWDAVRPLLGPRENNPARTAFIERQREFLRQSIAAPPGEWKAALSGLLAHSPDCVLC